MAWNLGILFPKKKQPDKFGTVSYMHLPSFCWSNVTCLLQEATTLLGSFWGDSYFGVAGEHFAHTRSTEIDVVNWSKHDVPVPPWKGGGAFYTVCE